MIEQIINLQLYNVAQKNTLEPTEQLFKSCRKNH